MHRRNVSKITAILSITINLVFTSDYVGMDTEYNDNINLFSILDSEEESYRNFQNIENTDTLIWSQTTVNTDNFTNTTDFVDHGHEDPAWPSWLGPLEDLPNLHYEGSYQNLSVTDSIHLDSQQKSENTITSLILDKKIRLDDASDNMQCLKKKRLEEDSQNSKICFQAGLSNTIQTVECITNFSGKSDAQMSTENPNKCYTPFETQSIYGDSSVFERAYKNTAKSITMRRPTLTISQFIHQISKLMIKFTGFRKYSEIRAVISELQNNTNLTPIHHVKMFSAFIDLHRRKMIEKGGTAHELWGVLARIIQHLEGEDLLSEITGEPLITNFYLSIASSAWPLEDLQALQRRVKQKGQETTASGDESSKRTLGCFNGVEQPFYESKSFIETLYYVNVILNSSDVTNKVIRNGFKHNDTTNEFVLFSTNFHALRSHLFMKPFFKMYVNITKLKELDGDIHTQYINRLDEIIKDVEGRIFEAFSPRTKSGGTLEILKQNGRKCGILNSKFVKNICETKIKDLINEWCNKLQMSTTIAVRTRQYLVINFLTTLSNLIEALNILLRGLVDDKIALSKHCYVMNGTLFKNIVFDAFNPFRASVFGRTLGLRFFKFLAKNPFELPKNL